MCEKGRYNVFICHNLLLKNEVHVACGTNKLDIRVKKKEDFTICVISMSLKLFD